MDKRARIILTGRVLEVGFHEYIDEKAFDLDLRGQVRNLEDGSVEIICEGPAEKLALMAERVDIRTYPVRVDRIVTGLSEPTGEFKDFDMIPDPRLEGHMALGCLASAYFRCHT